MTIRVEAAVFYRVVDALEAVIAIRDYKHGVLRIAQTTLRATLGQHDLDDLLANQTAINEQLKHIIDAGTEAWGVNVVKVETKDLGLPDTMKRAMARQAEAERERRAKVVAAQGEFQAAERLSQAAGVIAREPGTLTLRTLQTLAEVATEHNSTLVLPIPIDVLEAVRHHAESADEVDGQPASMPAIAGLYRRASGTCADVCAAPGRSNASRCSSTRLRFAAGSGLYGLLRRLVQQFVRRRPPMTTCEHAASAATVRGLTGLSRDRCVRVSDPAALWQLRLPARGLRHERAGLGLRA